MHPAVDEEGPDAGQTGGEHGRVPPGGDAAVGNDSVERDREAERRPHLRAEQATARSAWRTDWRPQ